MQLVSGGTGSKPWSKICLYCLSSHLIQEGILWDKQILPCISYCLVTPIIRYCLLLMRKRKVKKITGICSKERDRMPCLGPRSRTVCFLRFRLLWEPEKRREASWMKNKGESYIKSKVKNEKTWRIKGKSNKEAEKMKRQTERMEGKGVRKVA